MSLISIIIPLYNKELTIKDAIKSILSQSFTDFELIIVDDGSTDKGPNIVKSFQDDRIRLISQENQGVSKARNKGIEEAIGDWLLFLDADDKLGKDCLSILWNLHLKYPTVEVCAANYKIQFPGNKIIIGCSYSKGGIINNPFKLRWHKAWNLRLGAFILRKSKALEIKGFNTNIDRGEDTYFTDTLLQHSTVAYLPIPIMIYDRNNSNLSNIFHNYKHHVSSHLKLQNTNQYQNLINAEIIGKDIILAIMHRKWDLAQNLFLLYRKYTFFILKALVLCGVITIFQKFH